MFSFTLNAEQLERLQKALNSAKYKHAAPIIDLINQQLAHQRMKQQQAARAKDKYDPRKMNKEEKEAAKRDG